MKTLYRRVYIDGKEENLPKSEDFYIFGWDDAKNSYKESVYFPLGKIRTDDLLEYDWYLIPVTRERIIEDAERAHEKWLNQESEKKFGEFIADEIIGRE